MTLATTMRAHIATRGPTAKSVLAAMFGPGVHSVVHRSHGMRVAGWVDQPLTRPSPLLAIGTAPDVVRPPTLRRHIKRPSALLQEIWK